MDKGPWTVRVIRGTTWVYSSDRKHLVSIPIMGKFESETERNIYAKWLAEKLSK